MKDDIDADIQEADERREDILTTSVHEVQQGELSDLSEQSPEAASPTEELKVRQNVHVVTP